MPYCVSCRPRLLRVNRYKCASRDGLKPRHYMQRNRSRVSTDYFAQSHSFHPQATQRHVRLILKSTTVLLCLRRFRKKFQQPHSRVPPPRAEPQTHHALAAGQFFSPVARITARTTMTFVVVFMLLTSVNTSHHSPQQDNDLGSAYQCLRKPNPAQPQSPVGSPPATRRQTPASTSPASDQHSDHDEHQHKNPERDREPRFLLCPHFKSSPRRRARLASTGSRSPTKLQERSKSLRQVPRAFLSPCAYRR